MKKTVYLTMVVALVSLIFSTNASAQGVRQGNIIIDPYYGGPNFGKAFIQAVEEQNPGNSNFNASAIGPAGLRIEYMLGDRIGLGVDAIYNSRNITFNANDTITDGNGNQTIETNNYEYDMKRLRVQMRFNYHFQIDNPALDSYFGVGAGTNNRFRTTYENGVEIDGELSNLTLLKFSLRACLGMRYYFTDNIGLNAEIGIGGPLVSGGISVKF